MTLEKKISILIIEDNRLFRDGITAIINEQSDLKIVAAYSEIEKSLSKILKLNPDIVLIDLGLSSQNSLDIVKTIKKKSSTIKIIVMDLLPVDSDILDFVKAGAAGFILKNAKVPEFLNTIRSVASGEKILPSHMTDTLFSQIVERALKDTKIGDLKKITHMTIREREIIEMIADGLTNKEIAMTLHISPHTVKSHVHNILEKMALHTRIQIAIHTNKSRDMKDTTDSISLIENE